VRDSRPGLTDGCGFWIAAAGVFAVLGAVGITIAITEYNPPWPSAWFIAGAVMCTLGVTAVVWALVLYLAHREAERHWCPKPTAHTERAAWRKPATRPQAATTARAKAIVSASGAVGREDLVSWLLPLLREINGDLRQAAAGIEKANRQHSYSGVRHEFDLGRTWDDNRHRLAALEGQGDLYDMVRAAYASIARLRRIASFTALGPTQAHDLPGALETIRTAEIAVGKELADLG
jgi:hypothetical protein